MKDEDFEGLMASVAEARAFARGENSPVDRFQPRTPEYACVGGGTG